MSKEQVELMKRAFAGDDVVSEFVAEKQRQIEADMPKVDESFLPGWGSWMGDGVKAAKRRKQAPKVGSLAVCCLVYLFGLEQKAPVVPDRADNKLPAVIINDKRDKKVRHFYFLRRAHSYVCCSCFS